MFFKFPFSKNIFCHFLFLWHQYDISTEVAVWLIENHFKSVVWAFFGNGNEYVVKKIKSVFWIIWVQILFSDIPFFCDTNMIYRPFWPSHDFRIYSMEWFNNFLAIQKKCSPKKLYILSFMISKFSADFPRFYDTNLIYQPQWFSVCFKTSSREWFNGSSGIYSQKIGTCFWFQRVCFLHFFFCDKKMIYLSKWFSHYCKISSKDLFINLVYFNSIE